jgi:uncharacterized SAM-binding protein YcdF (DUF218 family)
MERLAVVVPGSSLAGTRRRLVAAAERAVRELGAEVVVFTGCASDEPSSEAALMRGLWRGSPTTELVCEETARTTAENAARTLPLLLERRVTEAVVICAPAHLLRARWIFRRIFLGHGVGVRFAPARVPPTPGALLWELGALAIAARQVRLARDHRSDS